MRRTLLLLGAALTVAACGSGDDTADTASDGLSDLGSVDVGVEPTVSDVDLPDAPDAGGQPSGARVRIVNVYAPLDGEPGAVDVYASPMASEGDTPIVSVDYGTVSEFFDPTVADDAGDMFLTMYAAGITGDDSLISDTETLAGGEVITYILATGSETRASGGRFGAVRTFFHGGNDFVPAPAPGTGSVFVDTLGLDQVVTDTSTYYYVGFGDGCAPAVGDTESMTALLGPGTVVEYALAPGPYQASIFTTPDCTGPSVVGEVPIEITDGGQSHLVIYGTAADDLRALFVPAP